MEQPEALKRKKKIKPKKDTYISKTVENIFDYVDKNFSKADIHIHTDYSDSASSVEEILDYVQTKTDLNLIAITDHNTIQGALKAQEMAGKKKYRFGIIIGEEITTLEGHLIGLFLSKPIQPNISVSQAIQEIHAQGGLAVSAHPFYQSRLKDMDEPIADGIGATALINEKHRIDAIEIVNGTPVFNRANVKAKYFNRLLMFRAEVGGSDAHFKEAIGKGYTIFEGKTAGDLKKAIQHRETHALKKRWNPIELLKYTYSFLPHALRMAFFTLLLGPQPKKEEIINFPSRYKIKRKIKKTDEITKNNPNSIL